MKKENLPELNVLAKQIKEAEESIELLTTETKSSHREEPNIPVVKHINILMMETDYSVNSNEILNYKTPAKEQLNMLTEFYRSSLLIILERERIRLEVEFEKL